jgi:hypothetical protein
MLIGYIYHHCRMCTETDCPIKFDMAKVTLVELFYASNLTRMLTRFIKKLDLMFEQQQKENPEALDVKISHLKLVLLHSHYKTKGLGLLLTFMICQQVGGRNL